jgi:uncharacterized protein DUF6152
MRAALVISIFFATPSFAHHSPAAYDQQRQITIDGVVQKYEWANPHVYIYVEANNGEESVVWQVEGGPPYGLTQQGWSRTTVAVGDHVVVTGNPPVNATRTIVFGRSLRKDDGTELAIYGRAPAISPVERTAVATNDLTGIWLALPAAANQPRFSRASTLPLTEKGATAVEGFVEESYPATACMPPVAPALMMVPDLKKVELERNAIRIRSDSWWGTERTIHLGVTSHDGASPLLHGHSIGRWEGNVFVVDTMRFADYAMGNGRELPSGSQKHLVERFEINSDRSSLTYRFVLTDPEYLSAPVTGELQWIYQPDASFAPVECDVANARRFLEE